MSRDFSGQATDLDAMLAAVEAGVQPEAARHLYPIGMQAPFSTTPTKRKPPAALIAAARLQIPAIMASIDQTSDPNGRVEPDGTVLMIAGVLVAQIRDTGHSVVAAEWAVQELIESGSLRVGLRWPNKSALPEAAREVAEFDSSQSVPISHFVVGSTESLWLLWEDDKQEDDRLVSVRDVAEIVKLSIPALSRRVPEWGKPDEPGAGNRGRRWRLSRLKPILKKQFPHKAAQIEVW